jgi:aminoglycoside phosphotransferase (APT) family kinase protein
MNKMPSDWQKVLAWCAEVLGHIHVRADHSREHPDLRGSTLRLDSPTGGCFVKLHRDRTHWESEVHAYERWAATFGDFAPRLLAVREEEPLALIISALPGRILEEVDLPPAKEQAVWRTAGQALAALHALPPGGCFGPARRDGSCSGPQIHDAREYITAEFDNWTERGLRIDCISADELAIVRDARTLIQAFAGEPPMPCHRDYCPANWLVTDEGAWSGVIDFEFSRWDVRAADFTRYPRWEWLERPEMVDAFFEGYGRTFTAEEIHQRSACHALYAIGAIVWGMENEYFIFAEEGKKALRVIGNHE